MSMCVVMQRNDRGSHRMRPGTKRLPAMAGS